MTDDQARHVIDHARSQGMSVVFNPDHKKFGKSKKRYEFYKHLTAFDAVDAAVLTPNMDNNDQKRHCSRLM